MSETIKKKKKVKAIPPFRLLADSLGMKATKLAEWLGVSLPYVHSLSVGRRPLTSEMQRTMEEKIFEIEQAAKTEDAAVPGFRRAVERRRNERRISKSFKVVSAEAG